MQVKRRSTKIRKKPKGNKFWRTKNVLLRFFRFVTKTRMKTQTRVKAYLKEIDAANESQLW